MAYVMVIKCVVVHLMVMNPPDLAAHKVIGTETITCSESVLNKEGNNETGNSLWFVSLGKQKLNPSYPTLSGTCSACAGVMQHLS